jgi:hypothetical protein
LAKAGGESSKELPPSNGLMVQYDWLKFIGMKRAALEKRE